MIFKILIMIITLFPTANAIYSGAGLSNPNNAHFADGIYVTATPAQNANQGTVYKSFGFDSILPTSIEVTKVRIVYVYKVDTAASIATARVKARISTAEQANHDDSSEPTGDSIVTVNITTDRTWTRADLLDVVFDVVLEARRGNNATPVTFSFDSVGVEVTYFNTACGPSLEACQLEGIQESIIGLLSERAIIQRQDLIDDNRGGFTPRDPNNPWPTIQSNVPCRVDITRIRPNERLADNRLTSEGVFDVSFPAGTDIRNIDRVTVATLDNRVFNMIGLRYASDEVLRVMASDEII